MNNNIPNAVARITLSQCAYISENDNSAINLLASSVAFGLPTKYQNTDNIFLTSEETDTTNNYAYFDHNLNQSNDVTAVEDHINTLLGNTDAVNQKKFESQMQQELETNIMKMCREEFPEEWTVIQVSKPWFPEMCFYSFKKIMKYNSGIFVSILKSPVIDSYKNPLLFKIIDIDSPEMFETCCSVQDVIGNIEHSNNPKSSASVGKVVYSRTEGEMYLDDIITRFRDYVRPWSCLFTGKFKTPQPAEDEIRNEVNKFLKTHKYKEKQQKLIHLIARRTDLMSNEEIYMAICDLLENPDLNYSDIELNNLYDFLTYIKQAYKYEDVSCYPVILIVDEFLDQLLFEYLNINQEMTRVSSFNLLKNLYLKHRNRIQDGYFMVSPEKGNALLNPDENLPDMESRMKGFYGYWLPKWKVHCGKPSSKGEIKDMLMNSDIYMFHGHGNGLDHFSYEEILRTPVNSVVFLFGCRSVGLNSRGFNQMIGAHLSYQTSLCPAIVGMLWVVYDMSCDQFSTKMLSYWLTPPANVLHHWTNIDLKLWRTGKVVFNSKKTSVNIFSSDNLLEIMSKVRSDSTESILTRAAMVCRGLPTKCMKN